MRPVLPPDSPHHGTSNGYFNYRCRCYPCVEAAREYQREYRKRDYKVYGLPKPSPPPKPPKPPKEPKYIPPNGRGEAEIVDAEPLGSHLRAWVVRWFKERPQNIKGIYGQQDDNGFTGPIQYLEGQTGINRRRINGINNGEFPKVPLSQADALLTAIGENWRLSPEIGDIEVKQNPAWSNESWHRYMQERGCI